MQHLCVAHPKLLKGGGCHASSGHCCPPADHRRCHCCRVCLCCCCCSACLCCCSACCCCRCRHGVLRCCRRCHRYCGACCPSAWPRACQRRRHGRPCRPGAWRPADRHRCHGQIAAVGCAAAFQDPARALVHLAGAPSSLAKRCSFWRCGPDGHTCRNMCARLGTACRENKLHAAALGMDCNTVTAKIKFTLAATPILRTFCRRTYDCQRADGSLWRCAPDRHTCRGVKHLVWTSSAWQ
jgi:hypothetical protein